MQKHRGETNLIAYLPLDRLSQQTTVTYAYRLPLCWSGHQPLHQPSQHNVSSSLYPQLLLVLSMPVLDLEYFKGCQLQGVIGTHPLLQVVSQAIYQDANAQCFLQHVAWFSQEWSSIRVLSSIVSGPHRHFTALHNLSGDARKFLILPLLFRSSMHLHFTSSHDPISLCQISMIHIKYHSLFLEDSTLGIMWSATDSGNPQIYLSYSPMWDWWRATSTPGQVQMTTVWIW